MKIFSYIGVKIAPLNHPITHACVTAERALCRRIGGGCQVPVAAFAHIHHHTLKLRGLVANRDGTKIIRAKLEGKAEHAEEIGIRVAEELIQLGLKIF